MKPRRERRNGFHNRHVAAVEERLRRASLGSDPAATEEDFAKALPEIREALRRRAVVGDNAP